MADPSPLPISNEDFEHFMRDLDTSLLVPDPEPEWQGPASDEPPIDVSLYSLLDQRSVTSFSSVHTRQSVASIPSISVPEEFSAQFTSLTLASEAVVQEAIRAVDALPQVHTVSKASFLRRYPMWIDHLEYVIVIALTLAFYDDQCILLFAEEFQFCNFMARHTIRSVFIIIEADRRKGGTLKDHSAECLYYMSCIVQWTVDALIELYMTLQCHGRTLVQSVGMIISDLRNNKLVFETMACDSMSYLDHPGDPNMNEPPIPLCQPAIWDMQYHCFYRMRGSMARRISDLLQRYPSLQHENGALMWLSNMPDNAFVVCGTVIRLCMEECCETPSKSIPLRIQDQVIGQQIFDHIRANARNKSNVMKLGLASAKQLAGTTLKCRPIPGWAVASMELEDSLCLCGRSFSQPSALAKHKRTCQKSKKRLSTLLDKAKEKWTGPKKHRRLDASDQHSESTVTASGPGLIPVPSPMTQDTEPISESKSMDPVADDDSHMTMMERRPWSQRIERQLPMRFRDVLPQPLPPLRSANDTPSSIQPPRASTPEDQISEVNRPSLTSRVASRLLCIVTPRNIFGLSRKYHRTDIPSYDPEDQVSAQDLSNISTHADSPPDSTCPFYPYPNRNAFRLGDWYWNGGVQKSQASFNDLMEIVGDPDFQPADVRNVSWNKINNELASEEKEEWVDEDAGWTHTPVSVSIPYQRRRGVPNKSNAGPRNYVVGDFYHRNLVSIIREKLSRLCDSHLFHFEPYELDWQPTIDPSQDPIRVQGELYTSPAFIEAHQELQDSPGEPGCDLPRVIVALMFWSDVTHLTAFGNAKLWPLYMFFGNESKYRRCRPSCHLCEHVAYFQTFPDSFKEFATMQIAGEKAPGPPFMSHCCRELMHEQWKILLDDAFVDAWKHGIVVTCWDGVKRRFYPRIFSYSADYKEKILISCIRNLGNCPCPRCLIPKTRVHNLGKSLDRTQRRTQARVDDNRRRGKVLAARELIYKKNMQVNCKAIEELLQETSLVLTANAFSDHLSHLGFNLYLMMLPDLMHEVEIGGWKALFIHLLWILESVDEGLLTELDCRYREIPSFGRDTIRSFSANCSEMKKMAAHDFENLLQCAIPVFDGLLPEPYNRVVLQLLFVMAHWHGLGKLRIHHDYLLEVMDSVTTSLGEKLRAFSTQTCPAFATRELRREYDARMRRQAETTVSEQTASLDQGNSKRLAKTLNLNTYKFHSFGDYVTTIRRYGTTDLYSTEPGELEHRSPKARYKRTSRKSFAKQLTQIERRQARLRHLRAQHQKAGTPPREEVAATPDMHHVIGKSQNYPENIPLFLQKHAGDPAIKDFVPKLKDHILPRIQDMVRKEAASNSPYHLSQARSASEQRGNPSDRHSVIFKNDRMYLHHLARFNYTTYDVRRAQDVINPHTSHRDIMLLASTGNSDNHSDHPFLYARVLGIYHVNVIYTGEGMLDYNARRVDFLWVRWFEYDGSRSVGWDDLKLDSVRFLPMAKEGAFGFVDPRDVLRGSHVIPAFARGKAHRDGVGLSRCVRDAKDWYCYCINRFADRDMIIRYHWGFGIGHIYSHGQTAGIAATRTSTQAADTDDLEPEANISSQPLDHGYNSDVDDPELGLENREGDDLGDEDGWEDCPPEDVDCDDEQLVAMDDMYGSSTFDDYHD